MSDTIKVLAISGSLRKASVNTALLRAAQELAPDDMIVEIYEGLGELAPYNDDVRAEGYPLSVERLRYAVRAADALIFATPEYNRSFSGVLQHAIDWVSRPPEQPFDGKVAAVMGAGPGAIGTAAANYHLRQVLSVLGVAILQGRRFAIEAGDDQAGIGGALGALGLADDPAPATPAIERTPHEVTEAACRAAGDAAIGAAPYLRSRAPS
jgi:chromate reductase, NAD(P)H dehydrogenase (quinone)